MRRKYKKVYKEEIARLKADRDFQRKEKKKDEKTRRKLARKQKRDKIRGFTTREYLIHYDKVKKRKKRKRK
ncbi:MAG: hypothetical protein B7C24_14085 [Bacteroidetes bacterium 4572_77]|nr:MAG: hypothetical protein B7C24_14085 [Bacteroidetes bacterium 4572_77]